MAGDITAILVPVHELEPALRPFRDKHLRSSATKLPPHVTVFYPFLPPEQVDDAVRAGLAKLFAGLPRFSHALGKTGRFQQGGVLYLAPEPAEPFLALGRKIGAAFPAAGPDRREPVMHVTIAQGGPAEKLDEVEAEFLREFSGKMPWLVEAREVCLYSKIAGVWRLEKAFPLGA
ncbi:MAG: 2'-5' RNA ligase family protein [Planctomycetota bacterium]|nr:2'-5' RNA ligase family protein [Planctomycetota bacterium]